MWIVKHFPHLFYIWLVKKLKGKRVKENNKILKCIFIICLIIFICGVSYLSYYFYNKNKDKNKIEEINNEITESNEALTELSTANIEKVKEYKEINNDVIGWIKIEDTKIDFPLLQNENNNYYLTHDYKNESNKYGSIFLKHECDINDTNSNLLIYGHNMKDEEMFNCLLNYQNKDYYEQHKTIKITTENEEREYEIVSVFKSRIFYKNEKNVFRFYYTFGFKNENEYNNYIENVKGIQLYDTGITANYGEQLVTLITCEYSQQNGRMVVVGKRIT